MNNLRMHRPYRARVGWKGKQRETLRGENPVRTGVPGVFPGQGSPHNRAHNPKVAGSNPAPAPPEKPRHCLGFLISWGLARKGRCGASEARLKPNGRVLLVLGIRRVGWTSRSARLLATLRGGNRADHSPWRWPRFSVRALRPRHPFVGHLAACDTARTSVLVSVSTSLAASHDNRLAASRSIPEDRRIGTVSREGES